MKYHRGNDGWGRGSYEIPTGAVAGCSDTGDGGPAPTETAQRELRDFQSFLAENGIPLTEQGFASSASGNCFMRKLWAVVLQKHYRRAKRLAAKYLMQHNADTQLIHDAAA
jgi:hypothetical protein